MTQSYSRWVTIACLAAATSLPAGASVTTLYNNETAAVSSINNADLWLANTFVLSSNATVAGFSWVSVNFRFTGTDDVITSIDWAIYDANPYAGGLRLAEGRGRPNGAFIGDPATSTRFRNEVDLGMLSLLAGTYWLEIGNGIMGNGSRTIAELGTGPSTMLASFDRVNAFSPAGSVNFQIVGNMQVSEPAGLALVLTALGLAAVSRSQKKSGLC